MTGKEFSLIMALVLGVSLFVGMATTIRAGDTETPLLRDLNELFVEVEPLDFRVEREGLTTEHLKTDAVNKLNMAGIKVQSEQESMTTPGSPRLHVVVKVLGSATGDYAAHIRVELREAVRLLRNPGMEVFTSTWTTGKFGVTHSLSDVRQQEQELIDKFINEYLTANPKQ